MLSDCVILIIVFPWAIQGLSGTLDLAQDVYALRFPLVGLGVSVSLDQVTLDVANQLTLVKLPS